MPDEADLGSQVRFTSNGISVAIASPERMFAMEALAGRQTADTDDVLALSGLLHVHTADLALVERYYRPERLAARTYPFLQALFGPIDRSPQAEPRE